MSNARDGQESAPEDKPADQASVEGPILDYGLSYVVEAVEAAKTKNELMTIAIEMIDPLLDEHWREVGDQFLAAMRASKRLRMAFSGTMVDVSFHLATELDALVQPDEDLGRQEYSDTDYDLP